VYKVWEWILHSHKCTNW